MLLLLRSHRGFYLTLPKLLQWLVLLGPICIAICCPPLPLTSARENFPSTQSWLTHSLPSDPYSSYPCEIPNPTSLIYFLVLACNSYSSQSISSILYTTSVYFRQCPGPVLGTWERRVLDDTSPPPVITMPPDHLCWSSTPCTVAPLFSSLDLIIFTMHVFTCK